MVSRYFMMVLLSAACGFLVGCDSEDPVTTPAPGKPLEIVIQSSDYLNHRFFRLDLPEAEPHGRILGDRIHPPSVRIFKLLEPGVPKVGDLQNLAVYVDSLGFQNWEDTDFSAPFFYGGRWREEFGWKALFDYKGEMLALDFETRMLDQDLLAVVYEVQRADGSFVQVGDVPDFDQPEQSIPGVNGLFYRMKLLKGPVTREEPHTFDYVLRNIYFLGRWNIDTDKFSLRIERLSADGEISWQDETGLDYIRIFGLDRDDPQMTGTPDGLVDWWDQTLFDMERGLVKFPFAGSGPFAPGGRILTEGDAADRNAYAFYAGNADTSSFVWNPSFLRHNQAWEIYDPSVYPVDYPAYSAFRIISTFCSEEAGCP